MGSLFVRQLHEFQKEFETIFPKRYRLCIKKHFSRRGFPKDIFPQLEKYILRGGKRIRPFLLFSAAGVYDRRFRRNNTIMDMLWSVAIAIELAHAAMLIHDDIVDEAELRRGKPALHRMVGEYQAINFGDIALSLGIYFIADACAKNKNTLPALYEFLRATIFTGGGQVLDLSYQKSHRIASRQLYRMYSLKTAHYSFESPLVMGLLIAGNRGYVLSARRVAMALGVYFQLLDDVADTGEDKQSLLKKAGISPRRELEGKYRAALNTARRSRLPAGLRQTVFELISTLHDAPGSL